MDQRPAFPITGFTDEASADLTQQIRFAAKIGLAGIDVRSVNETNVLDLDDATLERIAAETTEAGLGVQCIGSPVNKVTIHAGKAEMELDKLRRAIRAARKLDCDRVRIFTPEVPEDEFEQAWPYVRAWMKPQVDLATGEGIVLLHENDARFFGAYPENAKRLFGEFGGPFFRAAFDFSNTVLIGFRTLRDWFPWLRPHLDTLHIKDSIEEGRQIVVAGAGEGEILETLRYLIQDGWRGPLSLEPHLSAAGPFGGFSGTQLFEEAYKALIGVLEEAGGVQA